MEAFLLALGLVFAAELGDKTQLVVLALTGRSPPWVVFVGATAALWCSTALAAAAGSALGDWLPVRVVAAAAGALLILLGAWALLHHEADVVPSRLGFSGIFGLIFMAEFGDRTQLAVAGLASRGHAVQTLIGAALALAASTLLAVFVGRHLVAKLPNWWQTAAAWLFIAIGIVFIASAFW